MLINYIYHIRTFVSRHVSFFHRCHSCLVCSREPMHHKNHHLLIHCSSEMNTECNPLACTTINCDVPRVVPKLLSESSGGGQSGKRIHHLPKFIPHTRKQRTYLFLYCRDIQVVKCTLFGSFLCTLKNCIPRLTM